MRENDTMRHTRREVVNVELDIGRYELRRHGRRVRLEKKPMELLIFMVSRRDQLISRKEIVAKLWHSDLFIDTEPNINNIVRKIRTALGDNPDKPRFVETVVGKGYRFIGDLQVIDPLPSQADREQNLARGSSRTSASEWSDRSSLGVLPLLLLDTLSDDHGVSLGFADALVSRLANLQGVDVLPPSAVLSVPLEAPPSDIAAHLGVRFLVRGAIQELKGQLRLSLEMVDARLERVCFARKFDFDVTRLSEAVDETAKQVAFALSRPLIVQASKRPPRHSKDPLAYSEFMQGYRLSSSGDAALLDEAARHLSNAVTRDPGFSLAHAILSFVCATRHFEFDPTSAWLEKAEFHCRRALELDPDLPEGHVANAFLLWGPSKNFQHLEAIAELRHALTLQNNLPHAYNRLGTILTHVGLLDQAREMYQYGRPFHPQKAISHSIVQVYIWNREYDLARNEIRAWRAENPNNKYPVYFAPQPAMMVGDWTQAKALLDEALQLLPDEPLIVSLLGLFYALTGKREPAMECLTRACANPRSFGHAHHTYYQIAGILSVLGKPAEAFEWLERSVATGFACWPFFRTDPCLRNVRSLSQFDVLISSLQAKYPDRVGML
jgi:DNA-binding winged helix-turn-helix (wHTH) protein/Tfp pilus assembly protein PilF